MAAIFLSHSSHDRTLAARILERLEDEGFHQLFLSSHPEHGIPAGRGWERELYVRLRQADAVLFLSTAASLGSKWCFAELALARSMGKPVFPLTTDDGEDLDLGSDLQAISLSEGEQAFARLWRGLQRAGIRATDSFSWTPDRAPYPGLDPFAGEDAAVFHGRERETRTLLDLLAPLQRTGRGFVAVVGPSGSGKSSLVRAGLLPRLERMPQWLVVPPVVPGDRPTRVLARRLAAAFAEHGLDRSAGELQQQLTTEGSDALVELAEDLCDAAGGEAQWTLLFLDQAEELVTLTAAAERAAFVALLSGALTTRSPLRVVCALRSEFLGTFTAYPELAGALDDSLLLGPLDRARLPEVIERPAALAGLEFERGLVNRIVEDTVGGDAVPLLAYTLRQLYDLHQGEGTGSGTMTFDEYDRIGGVEGALRTQADRVLDALGGRGAGELVLPTLVKLAAVEGDNQPSRRRLYRRDLSPAENEVLQAFVDQRLLKTDGRGDEVTIEVAHEALFRVWRPLREEIAGRQDDLRLRSELDRAADDWLRSGQRGAYLLSGERLEMGERWVSLHPDAGSSISAFVRAGAQRRDEERGRQEALEQARHLSARVHDVLRAAPVDGLVQALHAAALNLEASPDDPMPAVSSALLSGIVMCRERNLLSGHRSTVRCLAFSPDGELLASGSTDRTVRRWTATGEALEPPLTGHGDDVSVLAFSDDGTLLASGGEDGSVFLWSREGSRVAGPLRSHGGAITALSFSPDSRRLTSADAAGSLVTWERSGRRLDADGDRPGGRDEVDLWLRQLRPPYEVSAVAVDGDGRVAATAGERVVSLWDRRGRLVDTWPVGHEGMVTALAFGPDGAVMASGGSDHTVRLLDRRGAAVALPFEGHESDVNGVAITPDATVVSASADCTVREWGLTGRPVGVGSEHRGFVFAVAVSGDGLHVVSGGDDRTVRLWSRAGGTLTPLTTIGQHEGAVRGVAFSPDGRWVASGGDDRAVRLWALRGGGGNAPVLEHGDSVHAVAFSPDGAAVLSGNADGTLRLWERVTGQLLREWAAHDGAVLAVAWASDGAVASGSAEGDAKLWDAATARLEQTFVGHEPDHGLYGIAFSPDGRSIATASEDGTVRLWDRSGEALGPPFRGHRGGVWCVSFGRAGDVVASGGADGTVRVWRGPHWRASLATACERLRHHPRLVASAADASTAACRLCEQHPRRPR